MSSRDSGRTSLRERVSNLAVEARLQLGLALHHAACDARAEIELGRAIALSPNHARARFARACIFHRSGRCNEAIDDLTWAIAERPDESDHHLLLAVCAAQRRDERLANQALRHATGLLLTGACAPSALETMGGTDRVQPHPRGGRQPAVDRERTHAVEQAVRSNPTYPDLRYRLALARLAERRPEAAEVELERALRINPHYLEARLLASRLLLDRGAVARAVRPLERAAAAYPSYPDVHFWLGFAWFRAGEGARAERSLELAIGLHREFARARRMLGVVRFQLGRADRALRSVRSSFARDRAIGTPPGFAPPSLVPAEAPEAEVLLRRALALRPDYPDFHLALACARRCHGDLERAAAGCRAALDLQPRYSTAAMELARIEMARGRHRDAAGLLVGLAERHPRWADAHGLLGRALRLGGEPSAAQPPLRAALSLNPGYSQAREDLAWALTATVPARKRGSVAA